MTLTHEPPASPSADELPAFPMARECPLSPPGAYKQMREERPVAPVRLWNGNKAWLVTCFDDVRKILADKRVSNNITHPGFPVLYAARAAVMQQHGKPPYFHFMDPPEHTEHRRMFTQDFSVTRVKEMEEEIQGVVDELIDEMLARPDRSADFVKAIALPIPTRVIARILGIPYADVVKLQGMMNATSGFNQDPEAAKSSYGRLNDYVSDLVAQKEANPANDTISRLISDQLRPGKIDRPGLIRVLLFLLIVGHETTTSMIALGTLMLLEHEEQREKLARDPSLTQNAVEELLRYLSIVHLTTCRVAIEDIEIGGETIKAGEGIVALISSANRDASQFENPDVLDINRDARTHVAFGFGVHQCLGQTLARLELRITLNSIVQRIPTLKLAQPIDELKFKSYINGVQSMTVAW
ncbi:MAG TPA: cytochrome P450 [Caulobacteraceae bacterium]|nr:cytochrome P450 [Caulobacteraceae bacterium]